MKKSDRNLQVDGNNESKYRLVFKCWVIGNVDKKNIERFKTHLQLKTILNNIIDSYINSKRIITI